MSWRDVPLPKRMRTLARDQRGLPVPFILLIDRSGQPQFTINDTRRVLECRRKQLCSVCGKRYDADGVWFVGGSRSFLHARGVFLDPPLHLECAEYALRVCPFLAAQRYAKAIEHAKLAPAALPAGLHLGAPVDFTGPVLPEQFGLGWTNAYRYVELRTRGFYVIDDWKYIEWWRRGERVNAPTAAECTELLLIERQVA